MNGVVVRQIFAAALDLQAGLGLIGDHRGASKIYHALDELDQAIRNTISIAAHPIHHASLTKAHEGPPGTPTLARAVPMNSPAPAGQQSLMEADGASCSLARGTGRG